MAVITFKVPYWYEIPYLLSNKPVGSGDYMVFEVIDGDTFVILVGKKKVRVRLLGIDTPEISQPYGLNARHCLARLVTGKKVSLYRTSTGRYRRTIALVYCDNFCVNSELLKMGVAWVYEKYCPRDLLVDYRALQLYAQSNKKGLWIQSSPVPPWVWRHRN